MDPPDDTAVKEWVGGARWVVGDVGEKLRNPGDDDENVPDVVAAEPGKRGDSWKPPVVRPGNCPLEDDNKWLEIPGEAVGKSLNPLELDPPAIPLLGPPPAPPPEYGGSGGGTLEW